jgi:hypothetical protein
MIFQFDRTEPRPRERADYGFARVRDLAFDAIKQLWKRRSEAGMKQSDLAIAIGRDPAWVSRNLRAPGNWTLRTIGELVEAMDGEVEIIVHAAEDIATTRPNFDAYAGYQKGPEEYPPPPALDGGQILDTQRSRNLRAKSRAHGWEDATQEVT